MDQFIDKHAAANELFEFSCPHCGHAIKTRPGAPGTAQITCKNCHHTMMYKVDPPRRPGRKKTQAIISVKVFPSDEHPGDYQIKAPLSPNTSYCFMCPKCSKIHQITTPAAKKCSIEFKHCSMKLHFMVLNNSNTKQGENIAKLTERPHSIKTEQVSVGKQNRTKACITWKYMLISREIELTKDTTIIGRDIKKYPCRFEYSGCNTCWRLSNGSKKYSCDIMFKDKYMSACSLVIEKELSANGSILYKATVMRAYNSVMIQQQEYPVGSSIYLNDGDIIKMGTKILTFKLIQEKNEHYY